MFDSSCVNQFFRVHRRQCLNNRKLPVIYIMLAFSIFLQKAELRNDDIQLIIFHPLD